MAIVARTTTVHKLPDGGIGYTNFHFLTELTTPTPEDWIEQTYDFWESIKGTRSTYHTATVQPEVPLIEVASGEITDMTSATGAVSVGTLSSEALPAAAQGLLSLVTSEFNAGRRLRGRVFIPGATEADSQGRPSTSYQAAILLAGNNLIADSTAAPWAVYGAPLPERQGKNKTLPARSGLAGPITATTARGYWASLRSRRVT